MTKKSSPYRCCDNYQWNELHNAVPVCKYFSMELVKSPIYSMKKPHCNKEEMPVETPFVMAKKGCRAFKKIEG